jgi:hypothetical protein
MKYFIIIMLGLIGIGCSNTTHLSLTENDKGIVRHKLNGYEKSKNIGAEVTLILFNGKEIEGELLTVRDSCLILCTEYKATESELANSTYPIILIKNNVIKELTFEGSQYFWTGLAAGYLAGSITGVQIAKSSNESPGSWAMIGLGGVLGSIAGGIAGYALSKEEFVLYGIPPNYNFYFLRNFARYEDKEPEYFNTLVKE